MTCKYCGSHRQSKFNGEIALRFPGMEGLDKPVVLIFPKVTVCLDCGLSEFQICDEKLETLDEGDAAAAAHS